ncbi:MAG TPA: metallophosphoesterase [Candidatus Saccharimonadales bacterium]|nr:metallophosphoesterase [Candidatus Saccharimonadales bacterium]
MKLHLLAIRAGCLFLGLHLACAQDIKVGIVGDQTLAPATGKQYEVLRAGVAALNREHPDVVLHTGDLLESLGPDYAGPLSPEAYTAAFASATGILNGLSRPWHLTAGDHDVNPPFFSPGNDTIRRLFQTLYLPAREHLYYSFNSRGYHFIALSSQEFPNADPRWGVVFRAHISQEQIDWLKADLRHYADKARGTAVFIHQPLWYQWADWAAVHDLLRKAKVAAVIAGHFHYNQDEGELDGIRYIVVGATGAITKNGSPEAGDLQHVTVIGIHGQHVRSVKLVPLQGEAVRSFSSRRDMDRVQALAVNLSNYFNDTGMNSNRVKQIEGSNQWKSCTGDAAATLTLHSIGNPLDLPVSVTVTVDSGNFQPTSSGFNPKVCPGSDGTACQLPAGTLIDYSNNSAVQPSYRACNNRVCAGTEPLWTAQFPSQTSDERPVSQGFTVTMGFRGTSGRALEVKQSFTLVPGCVP